MEIIMNKFYEKCRDRLIRYAKINTQSDPFSSTIPTTSCQFDLAYVLQSELREIGVTNVSVDEKSCIVYGEIPSNIQDRNCKSIGFVVHMDTSADAPGKDVKPWVCMNYDGGSVTLNSEKNIVMNPEDFPELKKHIGQDLIFTDGTTLLGGDDKSGIAVAMTMAEYLVKHPEIPHGPIKIAFTPDEEVGGLARDLDIEYFGADAAFTLDGDGVGTYSYETFNATTAVVKFKGHMVHAGWAKGIMRNTVDMASEFISMLPAFERPRYTEGREGYYHPYKQEGDVESTILYILVRDHDRVHFEQRKEYILKCAAEFNAKYCEGTAEVEFNTNYSSMYEVVKTVPWLCDCMAQAISDCGVVPTIRALRGGTDGSALSARGLPCPNLGAAHYYPHSVNEFVPIQEMEKLTEICVRFCTLVGEVR